MVYSTRRFVLCLALCYFVFAFINLFSIAITSLGEERANLSVFHTLFLICACLVLSILSSSWSLGRAAVCDCSTPSLFFFFFFFFFFILFIYLCFVVFFLQYYTNNNANIIIIHQHIYNDITHLKGEVLLQYSPNKALGMGRHWKSRPFLICLLVLRYYFL